MRLPRAGRRQASAAHDQGLERHLGHAVRVSGAADVLRRRTRLAREVLETLQGHFKPSVSSRSAQPPASRRRQATGKTISNTRRSRTPAADYNRVCDWVLATGAQTEASIHTTKPRPPTQPPSPALLRRLRKYERREDDGPRSAERCRLILSEEYYGRRADVPIERKQRAPGRRGRPTTSDLHLDVHAPTSRTSTRKSPS